MKRIVAFGILFAALSVSAEAVIERSLVRQQWPWNGEVFVDYRLLNDAGEDIEVKVSVTNGTREIVLPSRALTGPRMGALKSGDYRLTIDSSRIDFAGAERLDDFRVVLSVVEAPADAHTALYRIYDLTSGTGGYEEVTKAALLNGEYGDVETSYAFAGPYEPTETVIWTGVTNNPIYRTDRLVMRYVPNGSFNMLPNTSGGNISVTLTKPFYIGVFEMTYAQCERISAGRATMSFSNETVRAARPMDFCSFANIRGETGTNWPEDEAVTGAQTYIYRIRRITGDNTFDLPTEARWEYAARAGVTTRWNNGSNSTATGANNPACNVLCRSKYTGGWIGGTTPPEYDVDASNGTAIVGSYLPNAWGIYDMHGNVAEWCLDRWSEVADLSGGIDPVGSTASDNKSNRVLRGRCWHDGTTSQYIDNRFKLGSNSSMYITGIFGTTGFRLICEAESAQ